MLQRRRSFIKFLCLIGSSWFIRESVVFFAAWAATRALLAGSSETPLRNPTSKTQTFYETTTTYKALPLWRNHGWKKKPRASLVLWIAWGGNLACKNAWIYAFVHSDSDYCERKKGTKICEVCDKLIFILGYYIRVPKKKLPTMPLLPSTQVSQ